MSDTWVQLSWQYLNNDANLTLLVEYSLKSLLTLSNPASAKCVYLKPNSPFSVVILVFVVATGKSTYTIIGVGVMDAHIEQKQHRPSSRIVEKDTER